jgi:hypothetical protein
MASEKPKLSREPVRISRSSYVKEPVGSAVLFGDTLLAVEKFVTLDEVSAVEIRKLIRAPRPSAEIAGSRRCDRHPCGSLVDERSLAGLEKSSQESAGYNDRQRLVP